MRVSAALIVSLFGLAACGGRPAYQPESNVNETISVTASPVAIRGLESDLRNQLVNSRDDPAASVSFNEFGGPRPRTVDADPRILNAAFDDAQRKAAALAASVHARLGDPVAVDEVNAADPMPRYGGAPGAQLKGSINASRVTVNGDGPEIVRVTFAITSHAHAPATITVYGMQTSRPAAALPPPTQLSISISAGGSDALKTVGTWETFVRDAGRRRGVRDADINVGNVNANIVRRPR